MWQLTLLLLSLHALAQSKENFNQEKCVIDNRSLETIWELKLIDDLTNCTKYLPPPRNNTEPLIVKLKLFMNYFTFNVERREFKTAAWMMMAWQDERLKWDPKKYDGIVTIPSISSRIWTPLVKLINGMTDLYEMRYINIIPCGVDSQGMVNCVVKIVIRVKCDVILRDWPYDAQYCKIEIGPRPEPHITVQFDIGLRAMELRENGTEWNIKDYQQILDETSEKQLVMKFRLERHTEGLAAIIIYPSFVLTILTLSSSFLDARLQQRLFLACFSLMCHFYFMTDLSLVFPENTKDAPSLLMYYRGSCILTSIITGVSFLFNVICKKDVECPDWITSVNDLVFTKVVILKYFVLPRWKSKIEDGQSKFAKDWTDFANIVNAVSTFVLVIVYVSLYCVFMPQPNSFD